MSRAAEGPAHPAEAPVGGASAPRDRWIATIAILLPLVLAAAGAGYPIWLAGSRFDATRHARRVELLRAALAAGDLDAAAAANATLGQEGFLAARACVRAWRTLRDRETGLFPRGGGREAWRWKAEDNAADLFPHLLYAAIRVSPEDEATWRAVLAAERRLGGGSLPRTIDLRSGAIVEQSEPALLQGAAEYAADGLEPLVERLGNGPWLDRLREVADAVVARAAVTTDLGPIPSGRAEVNGNLLQVLARLYPLTHDERELTMAERIAAWYLFEIQPRYGPLPPLAWDVARGAADRPFVKLRDHGGEAIPGLAELYLLERTLGRPFADRMRAPIEAMLDAMVAAERTPAGLLLDHLDPVSGRALPGDRQRVVDTWGYVANALVMAELATPGGERFGAGVDRMMSAVSRAHGIDWDRGSEQDGYADSIESMLCLLPFRHVDGAAEWIDDEIAILFAIQRDDGFVKRDYLDGNFVRTAMLYAEWKARGARLEPWREDLLIGAVESGGANGVATTDGAADRGVADGSGAVAARRALRLHLAARAPWSGKLHLDGPRHRTSWGMSVDYPRRNGSPEWFTVEPGRYYVVRDLDTGAVATHDGAELLAGIALTLEPGRPRRWSIEAR